MDNIILSGMLTDFSEKYELSSESPDRQFEKFANFCLLKTDHYDSFDFDKVATGDCMGVDGVAVIINGVIVNELDDAQAFTKTQFDAKFFFSQVKTSSSLDTGDVLKFLAVVRAFFGRDISVVPPELHGAFEIKSLIYSRAAKMRQPPTVELAYVYSGRYEPNSSHASTQIEVEVNGLKAMPYLFSDVTCRVCDGEAMARLYRETQNDIQKEISFQRHVALPPIQGARAAYLGVVSCKDYVRMIEKDNRDLNKGIFFDNVRDYLGGGNPVNQEIAKTINDPDERNQFAILNNGVTIVAKNVIPSGDNFKISRFQVANGCQTSNVLFSNRDTLTDDMYITVKLIETSDVDLSGKVIETTNSQSQVTKEAFATIRPYHRSIEDFFTAMRSTGFSYNYERRPHQFDGRDDIRENSIVTTPSLIKSFISVVLEEPHKVHYYYGRLLSEYNSNKSSELFAADDYPGLYFASHHIVSRVKQLCGKQRDLYDWAFHLALLVKKQVAPVLKKEVALDDKKFLQILRRIDQSMEEAFQHSVGVLRRLSPSRNHNRLPEVTDRLLHDLGRSVLAARKTGAVASTRPEKTSRADGRYVGQLISVDHTNGTAELKYGPYSVKIALAELDLEKLRVGSRVQFIIRGGDVSVDPQSLQ